MAMKNLFSLVNSTLLEIEGSSREMLLVTLPLRNDAIMTKGHHGISHFLDNVSLRHLFMMIKEHEEIE